jgi:hypothetical protein
VGAGHEVHGMTRGGSKRAMLEELGAVPVVADALDPDQVGSRASAGSSTPTSRRTSGHSPTTNRC